MYLHVSLPQHSILLLIDFLHLSTEYHSFLIFIVESSRSEDTSSTIASHIDTGFHSTVVSHMDAP